MLYGKAVLAGLFLVMLLLVRAVWGAYQKYSISGAALADTLREHDRLSERTDTLTADIARLGTDRGVEQALRANFQVAKPGEEVIVVVDTDKPIATTTPQVKRWWEFWK